MKRQILIIMLFIFEARINGMQSLLSNTEVFSSITEQLCIINKWSPKKIKHHVKNLACCSKFLHLHYMAENTAKEIIRKTGLHKNKDDLTIAKLFCHKIIIDKIENLFGKPPKYTLNFCPDDLKDGWYLNATTSFPLVEPEQQTLLLRAIEFIDINKITMLINAKINLRSNRCENPLRLAFRRYFCGNNPQEKSDLFCIITLLLENNLDPDITINMKQKEITPLMQAGLTGNQKLAGLLMQYGANPYETIICQDEKDSKNKILVNCFELEQSVTFPFLAKGWLKTMYNEIQGYKNKG